MTVPSGQASPRPWDDPRVVRARQACAEANSRTLRASLLDLPWHDDGRYSDNEARRYGAWAIAARLPLTDILDPAVNGWDALRGERDRLLGKLRDAERVLRQCHVRLCDWSGEQDRIAADNAQVIANDCRELIAALGSGRPSAPEEEK